MLRPYIPDTNTFYFADPRSVRVCVSSSAVTRTPAVDNNPASKAPKSGNGRLFSELGAEHLNSSRRSCVTYFFSAVPHPFFSNNSPTIIIESPGPTECRPAARSGAAEFRGRASLSKHLITSYATTFHPRPSGRLRQGPQYGEVFRIRRKLLSENLFPHPLPASRHYCGRAFGGFASAGMQGRRFADGNISYAFQPPMEQLYLRRGKRPRRGVLPHHRRRRSLRDTARQ